MKRFFTILILMLSVFSIASAHPFKTEKELQDFYAKIDKEVDKELKKDYLKLFEQRKANLKEKASDDITEKNLEDDEYLFVFKNEKLEMVFKKEILNGKFIILSRLYENGKKSRIVCLSRENTAYYGTVKYFRENGTPLYSGQFYAGKMEGIYKEYYESGKIFKEINFINDKENGQGKIYYEDGKILRVVNLKNGKENGDVIDYYPNGRIKNKAHFIDGELNGEVISYSENGNIIEKVFMQALLDKGKPKDILDKVLKDKDKIQTSLHRHMYKIYKDYKIVSVDELGDEARVTLKRESEPGKIVYSDFKMKKVDDRWYCDIM